MTTSATPTKVLGETINERHINALLVQDIASRLGTTDLFAWIEMEAERLGSLGRIGDSAVEFTSEILSARAIRRMLPGDVVGSACILPENDGYTVYYKQNLPEPPRRFAIAHEIAHTYFFAPNGGGQPLSECQLPVGRDPSIEYLCDRFAAAFLLPFRRVLAALEAAGAPNDSGVLPLHMVPVIAGQFGVPEQAAARRLFFELFPSPLALVCVRRVQAEAKALLDFGDGSTQEDRWETSWCAFPSALHERGELPGLALPLKRSSRIIPNEWIPAVTANLTHSLLLDGRWWDVIEAQPLKTLRRRLGKWPPRPQRQGYVARVHERLYFALPIDISQRCL